MNRLIEEEFPLHETQSLRYDMMAVLTDDDLTFKLPGDNPTLGELCREMGDLERIYIEAFKTCTQDWTYRNDDPDLATSIDRLTAWYRALDDEFEHVMRGFTDDALNSSRIDRGHQHFVSVYTNFMIYREAIMMFYAKASVYLKALQRPVNARWQSWIG